MLSKLFHKKITSERPHIPPDPVQWPKSWNTVAFKEYPRFDSIPLPKDSLDLKSLKEAFEMRRSKRIFRTHESVSLEELATLLHYSAGIQSRIDNDTVTQEVLDRTKRFYPSGGGRYPLEVYLAAQRVSRVSPGLYHYNVLQHTLECLLDHEYLRDFEEMLAYPWSKDAAVVVIITAVWDRNFIKYHNLGYPMILTEAGHLAQNLLLTATSLEMSSCPFVGFDNQKVNKLLDIDEVDEAVLYMVALGK